MPEQDPPPIEPGTGRLVYDKARRTIVSEQKPADYTAWLIEIDEGASINYFQMLDDDDWTFDQNAALHFARKQDAEKMIAYYGWTHARAVEHMWPETKPR